jgi:hypothetical protein
VIAGGVIGAMVGFTLSGFAGAVLGFGAGVMAGGAVAERGRFYRG